MALERELKIVRSFDAPRELVWKAWTDPAHVAQWWGPRGFANPVCEWDARPGGRIYIVMRASGEIAKAIGRADHPMTGEFTEVVPAERLAFVSTAVDDSGKPLLEALTMVRFAERGGKTEMVLHASAKGFVDIAARMLDGMDAGWTQSIDKLEEHLGAAPDTPEFSIVRAFKAPRDLVWKAHTELNRLAQWWGPKGFAWVMGTLDFRPGGTFHYCMRAPDGGEMWGKFVYREIAEPGKIVFVTSFSDKDGRTTRAPFAGDWPLEVLNALTLEDRGGETLLTLRGSPLNATGAEKRRFESMRGSMDRGFAGTFERLDEYLAHPETSKPPRPKGK